MVGTMEGGATHGQQHWCCTNFPACYYTEAITARPVIEMLQQLDRMIGQSRPAWHRSSRKRKKKRR